MSIATAEIRVYGPQHEHLVQSQLDLINNPEYSDITVHCEDRVWHCHQAILFQRCPALGELVHADGDNRKVVFADISKSEVIQLLKYIYTLELPKFLPSIDYNDYEYERTNIWITAANAYRNGVKYRLGPLKKAGLEVIMLHAPRLFKSWEQLDPEMQRSRIELVDSVYANWEGPENEIGDIKWAILKGLVRHAQKMADSPHLQAVLRKNQAFMIDYTWAIARKIGKKRKGKGAIRGGREAPIVVT